MDYSITITIHILINASIKNKYECWVARYYSVKNSLCDKVAHKICTQKQCCQNLDFVLTLGFLSLKPASLAYANEAY